MLFISTANLVSVLALGSTMTGLVLAIGPRPQCIGMGFQSSPTLGAKLIVPRSVHTEKYKIP
jgi:hypothetical protein